MEPEDLDLLYTIENDTALWDVSTNNVPYSRHILRNYIAAASGDVYADQQVRLVIENGVGEAVGLADLTSFDARNCRAEVGLAILASHRGRGYGSQALAQLAGYARRVLHLHQLYAFVDAGNARSLQMLQNAGFAASARLKDWLYDGREYHEAILMQIFF